MHCKIVFALVLIQATWTLCLGRCHRPADQTTTAMPTTTEALPPTTAIPTTPPAPPPPAPTTAPVVTTVSPPEHGIAGLNYCPIGEKCCHDDGSGDEICCIRVPDSGITCETMYDCGGGTNRVCYHGLCKCSPGYIKQPTTGYCVQSCTLGSSFTYYPFSHSLVDCEYLEVQTFGVGNYVEEDYCFTLCAATSNCNAVVLTFYLFEEADKCLKVYECYLYNCMGTPSFEPSEHGFYMRDCEPEPS